VTLGQEKRKKKKKKEYNKDIDDKLQVMMDRKEREERREKKNRNSPFGGVRKGNKERKKSNKIKQNHRKVVLIRDKE
jgi:hypothetical protein